LVAGGLRFLPRQTHLFSGAAAVRGYQLTGREYHRRKTVWIVESNFIHDRITETKALKDPHYDNLARLLSKVGY
jgi:hypothetical protein